MGDRQAPTSPPADGSGKPAPPPAPPRDSEGESRVDVDALTEEAGLALILTALFGVNATEPIADGGYIRFYEGRGPGILQQIDERLLRLERLHDLGEIRFFMGDDLAPADDASAEDEEGS